MTFWDMTFEPYLKGSAGDEDGRVALAFISEMEAMLASRGVVKSIPLVLRLEEVLSTTLKVRALEAAARPKNATDDPPGAKTEPEVSRFLEPLGKLLERRRKALADLEEACGRAGTPIEAGLADMMKPIIKQAEGVLEKALVPRDPKRETPPATAGC